MSFLPGTYATSLFRNHATGGVLLEMESIGVPQDVLVGIRDAIDSNVYFFKNQVSIGVMYSILGGAVVLLTVAYILVHKWKSKKK